MRIGSIEPSSEEGDELGLTDGENSEPHKPLEGCFPRFDLNSGVGESSKGCGGASLLETLKTRRVAQLEILAACAPQGALEFLRNDVLSPHSAGTVENHEGDSGTPLLHFVEVCMAALREHCGGAINTPSMGAVG